MRFFRAERLSDATSEYRSAHGIRKVASLTRPALKELSAPLSELHTPIDEPPFQDSPMIRCIPSLFALAVAVTFATSARADEPAFSSALQKQAGPMIEQLKKKGCLLKTIIKLLL